MQRPEGKPLTLAVFGARGTGKTAHVLQHLQKTRPPRLLVWDFKHDPGLDALGVPMSGALGEAPAYIRAMRARRFAIRVQPDHAGDVIAQFDVFCRAAWAAGNLVMVVDELAEVTKANKAPAAWRRCVNVGRDYRGQDGERKGLAIIGVSQRAAEVDKSFVSNVDVIHVGRLTFGEDARAMARTLGVRPEEISSLPDLHWIERRAWETAPARGVLSFGNARAKKTPPKPARKKAP